MRSLKYLKSILSRIRIKFTIKNTAPPPIEENKSLKNVKSDELSLYRGDDYYINDYISIKTPILNDICEYGEQNYWHLISVFTSTPADYKVTLYDTFDIDYEKVDEFEFFYTLTRQLTIEETSILFGKDLDFSKFEIRTNEVNEDKILFNTLNNAIIDRFAYIQITDYLRKVHGFKKNCDVAANENTKMFLIDMERRELMRNKNKKFQSILVPLISTMTNCEQFKYNYHTVWNLPLFYFNDCVKRIQVIKSYDNIMMGAYSGCVDLSKMNKTELNWLRSLD